MLLVAGCQQKVICNKPYILIGTNCCLDKNDNQICDSDEPTNTPVSSDVPVQEVVEKPQATPEPNITNVSKINESPVILEQEQKIEQTTVQKQQSTSTVKTSLNWMRLNRHMQLTVDQINASESDSTIMLRTITVTLKNLDLDFLTPRFDVVITDDVDTQIFRKTFGELNSYFYTTEGWEKIPLGKEQTYVLQFDERIPRIKMKKDMVIEVDDPYHKENPPALKIAKDGVDLLNPTKE
jgi:hypothetical protein